MWRKFKRLGVAQLLDSLVALPLDSETREQLEWAGQEILDADGEAARLQMRASAGGALFDGILDRVADVAIVAGTGVWALDAVPSVPALVLVLAVAASFGSVISMASKDRISAHALPHANERALAWLLGGRDGRLFIVAVCGILGLPMVALVAITATSISTLGLRLIAVRRITT